jgi:SSS family solute:Na+ symporter
MNPGQIRLLMIVLYLALLLVLGFFASRFFRGTKNDYLLASHTIGPFLLLMSLFGTTMTAFALVGSTAESYKAGIGVYGLLASSSGIVHSLCFFLIGVKLYSHGRRHGYSTQIQFFRDRLESDFVGVLLFPILVGLIVPYLLLGVMAGGTVIQSMTAGAFPDFGAFAVLGEDGTPTPVHGGIPPWLGSLVICAVVLIYVYFGGMRGTAWANTFQTLVFMILGLVTFVMLANRLGGGASFYESLKSLSQRIPTEFTTRSEMSKTKFLTYMFIPLSVAMFPHIFQHWLTAKSAGAFKVPVIFQPIFIMVVWVPCVLIGVWAHTVDIPASVPANAILPYLVNSELSPVIAGLLTAGILAAIMSSLDSQFLCLGSMFTNDIVDHYAGKDKIADSRQVWIARMFVLVIVGVTYYLSLQGYRSVFAMGVWCFSGFAALFPLVFAALYWKRLTAAGAVSSILATMGSWLYLFQDSGWGADRAYAIHIPYGNGVIVIMPVVAIFLCSLISMVVTSYLTRPPSETTLGKFFAND